MEIQTTKVIQIEQISASQFVAALKLLESKLDQILETPPPAPAPGYMNRQQVAKLLNISSVTVWDWTNKGFLKAYKLGNKVFYKASEIDASMTLMEAKRSKKQ